MAIKMIISKPGVNALTETDPQNFIFDSNLNHLKTAGSGTMTLSAAANGTIIGTIGHSLGYNPLILAYYHNTGTVTDEWYPVSTALPTTGGFRSGDDNVSCFSGTNNIGFYYKNHNSTSSATVDILYEYFYEGSE